MSAHSAKVWHPCKRKTDAGVFINQRQQWVIEPRFEDAREFQGGKAAARQNGKWGFINKHGECILRTKAHHEILFMQENQRLGQGASSPRLVILPGWQARKLRIPRGKFTLTVPSSPSDHRAFLNFRRDVHHALSLQ